MTTQAETSFRRALIIGDSGGIGHAIAAHLRAEGCDVLGLSRTRDGFDLTNPEKVERILKNIDGHFDLICVASGILAPAQQGPEKSLSALDAAAMAEVLAVNAIGPALVLRHVPRLLSPKARAVVAVLTARVGSIGDNRAGGWYSYRASKAAANQIVHTAAIEIARKYKQACVVALHPGTVDTAFSENYQGYSKHSTTEASANLIGVMKGLSPAQTGQFFDWAGKPVPW